MGLERFFTKAIVLGLRIVQAILAILVLGLTAYVANWWSTYWHSTAPSQVAFLVFASVFALLALAYLTAVPLFLSGNALLNNPILLLALEGLTMLFWFAGFIALAVFLSDRVCFGAVCAAAKAADVFAAFSWLAWVGSTGMATVHFLNARKGAGGTKSASTAPAQEGV